MIPVVHEEAPPGGAETIDTLSSAVSLSPGRLAALLSFAREREGETGVSGAALLLAAREYQLCYGLEEYVDAVTVVVNVRKLQRRGLI